LPICVTLVKGNPFMMSMWRRVWLVDACGCGLGQLHVDVQTEN